MTINQDKLEQHNELLSHDPNHHIPANHTRSSQRRGMERLCADGERREGTSTRWVDSMVTTHICVSCVMHSQVPEWKDSEYWLFVLPCYLTRTRGFRKQFCKKRRPDIRTGILLRVDAELLMRMINI